MRRGESAEDWRPGSRTLSGRSFEVSGYAPGRSAVQDCASATSLASVVAGQLTEAVGSVVFWGSKGKRVRGDHRALSVGGITSRSSPPHRAALRSDRWCDRPPVANRNDPHLDGGRSDTGPEWSSRLVQLADAMLVLSASDPVVSSNAGT
jgi:hypothetical protein